MQILLEIKERDLLKYGSVEAFGLSLSNKYLALAGTKGVITIFNLETDLIEHSMSL